MNGITLNTYRMGTICENHCLCHQFKSVKISSYALRRITEIQDFNCQRDQEIIYFSDVIITGICSQHISFSAWKRKD